ncbi:hypothetical protein BH11PLA1_BH11PLA1_05380 [soil metagenome]
MSRTFLIALREFKSVVLTRGFLLGVVIMPVMLVIAILGVNLLPKTPALAGRVVVVDRSGAALPLIQKRFGSAVDDEEAQQASQDFDRQMDKSGIAKHVPSDAKAQGKEIAVAAAGAGAELRIEPVTVAAGDEARLKELKSEIGTGPIRVEANKDEAPGARPVDRRVALVVIPENAVTGTVLPDGTRTWPAHELSVHPRLDFEIAERINRRVAEALVDARIAADPRFKDAGLAPPAVRAAMEPHRAKVQSLNEQGDSKASAGALQIIVPLAFMLLMMMSVMTGGQYLMTALVEEKSSRVMEVLLSAVSPMQLMVGKIVGMMGVAMVILVVYGGAGMAGLVAFAMADLVEPIKLVWLGVYFLCAFFTVASLMAAIGSAVNDIREAQTLLSPVMMIVMLPWLLWMPISRAPNSTFSTVASFIPGLNPFVMVIRLGGSEEVPPWQLYVGALVGVLTAAGAAWCAAKVFRIGVLMYGKPPNLSTLVRWVRMA